MERTCGHVNVDSTSTGKRKEELKHPRAPPGCHPVLSPPEEEPVLDQHKHSYSRVQSAPQPGQETQEESCDAAFRFYWQAFWGTSAVTGIFFTPLEAVESHFPNVCMCLLAAPSWQGGLCSHSPLPTTPHLRPKLPGPTGDKFQFPDWEYSPPFLAPSAFASLGISN